MCSCRPRASQVQQRRVQHRTRWLQPRLPGATGEPEPLQSPTPCPHHFPPRQQHAPRLPQLRPLPRHRRRSLRVPGTASTAVLRLAGRRSRAVRPVSVHLSWGARSSTPTTPAAASGSALTRSWARCSAALAATGSRRGFAAGWRACRDVPALPLGDGPRLGKITRCARCLPTPAALCMPAIHGALSLTVAGPTEAHHAACMPESTLSPPARPPSQVSIRRSFWRLGAGGGRHKRGKAGGKQCGGAWDAKAPPARDVQASGGPQIVLTCRGLCFSGTHRM
jgi:hypothetical protein